MGRVSRDQAAANRKMVVRAASRLFRERGTASTSVADVMAGVGLTQGGFYKQFQSKDALVAEAVADAFSALSGQLGDIEAGHPGDRAAARRALIDYYLSAAHRDDAGHGCPTAGFGPDVSRTAADSGARKAYQAGVEGFAAWLGDGPAATDASLVMLCELVGALTLSRATAGSPLSDRILAAVRADVLGSD